MKIKIDFNNAYKKKQKAEIIIQTKTIFEKKKLILIKYSRDFLLMKEYFHYHDEILFVIILFVQYYHM